MKKEGKIALFVLLLVSTVSGGYLVGQKYGYIPSDITVSSINGLETGDRVRIEKAYNDSFQILEDTIAKHEKHLTKENNVAEQADDKSDMPYNFLVNITPHDSKSSKDVSFLVNPQSGIVRTALTGFDPQTKADVRINGHLVESGIPMDWGGQTSIEVSDQSISKKDASICVDVGGYRGGSLSVCHVLKSPSVKSVQFSFGGGGVQSFSNLIASGILSAMASMSNQFSATMLKQVEMIGMLLDAKHQLETQRLIQTKYAQAHKDYYPSEQMCTIGTFVRNLAQTEGHVKVTKVAINEHIRARELASGRNSTFRARSSDMLGRLDTYRENHCEEMDNDDENRFLCNVATNPDNQNADVNYTKTIELPLTLNIELVDPVSSADVTDTERNVFSLLNNLFMARSNSYLPPAQVTSEKLMTPYQDLRSLTAMRGIARNSFANILAQKSSTNIEHNNNVAPYMMSLMSDFGLPEEEIVLMLGENPSYFAQMELLTKKLYQHPSFFANLYDKPVNVKRMRAAMKAIKLMQDKDIYDALLRREMLLSMILEVDLRKEQNRATNMLNASTTGIDE